jgi:Synergist-CTERM protein sorting domain-containing protein
LGSGNEHANKYVVLQIDLTDLQLSGSVDKWIKVVGSHSASNWNNIHVYDSSAGQNDHKYKVRTAQPNNVQFDGNTSVTPYCDENQYNIYVHIKKVEQPLPPAPDVTEDSAMTSDVAGTPAGAAVAAGSAFTITGKVINTDYTNVELVASPSTAVSNYAFDSATGTFTFDVTMPSSTFTWYLTADKADGTHWKSSTSTVTVAVVPTPTITLTATAAAHSISGTVEYKDASGNPAAGKSVTVSAQHNTDTPITTTVTTGTDGKAVYTISGLTADTTYTVAASDGTVNSAPQTVPTTSSDGGSSGGCDAGFAGLALFLAAPLFLKRKSK